MNSHQIVPPISKLKFTQGETKETKLPESKQKARVTLEGRGLKLI